VWSFYSRSRVQEIGMLVTRGRRSAKVTKALDPCYPSSTPQGDVAVFHGAARAAM
jgi:hypothetical protein